MKNNVLGNKILVSLISLVLVSLTQCSCNPKPAFELKPNESFTYGNYTFTYFHPRKFSGYLHWKTIDGRDLGVADVIVPCAHGFCGRIDPAKKTYYVEDRRNPLFSFNFYRAGDVVLNGSIYIYNITFYRDEPLNSSLEIIVREGRIYLHNRGQLRTNYFYLIMETGEKGEGTINGETTKELFIKSNGNITLNLTYYSFVKEKTINGVESLLYSETTALIPIQNRKERMFSTELLFLLLLVLVVMLLFRKTLKTQLGKRVKV